MIEIAREEADNYSFVYEYEIKEESPRIFEYVQKLYSDKNKWGKKQVLTDVIIRRCPLDCLLHKVCCARETLELCLQSNFKNGLLFASMIDEMNSKEKISITLPQKNIISDRGCINNFRGYLNTFYPLQVIVSSNEISDFSRYFQDFDVYQEKAVDKACEVLMKENYPRIYLDKTGFENALKNNIRETEEFGLI